MKTLLRAIAVCSVLGTGVASAGPVDPSNVTTFQSGTPALAAEVNANFLALITAINDNAARLAALEGQGGPVLQGATYCLFALQTGLGASNISGVGSWLGGSAGVFKGSVTFTSPTAGSLTAIAETFKEVVTSQGGITDTSEPPGTEPITWSLSGSNILTIDEGGGEIFTLLVTPDGSTVIGTLSEAFPANTPPGGEAGNWFSAELIVGVRASSCQ